MFAIMATLTGFSLNAWFLVFGFLATAGDELSEVSLWSWINSLDARHDQDGSLTAIVVLFGDLGYAVGPVIAGFLYGIVGPAATIALCAIPIFGLWLGFAFLNARRTEGHAFDVPGGMRERLYRFRHKG